MECLTYLEYQDFEPKFRSFARSFLLSNKELSETLVLKNQLYSHETMAINYTMYDLWRESDSINVPHHSDIMMNKNSIYAESHPFMYACILKIFHAYVKLKANEEWKKIMALFVRYFDVNTSYSAWSS